MTPEQYERLREIYHRVCDEPPSRQPRLLDECCGDDPELRGRVERLLDIESREPDLLETPPASEPPRRVGRYRVVRVIGEGGMGIVYEAQQEDPRRRVALKVIRPGMVTRGLLRRFRQEADVLGRLQHPGIAQIYEAGTTDGGEGGRPFFAMELIEGAPIHSHSESNRLPVRDRLELIARVCDALHHAHRKGVTHRDLKPANILVTADGQPKVLDFGVARATDADVQTMTLRTDVGQLVGTIPYMSPEQAAGDPAEIDVRSDVYSLGVIAYELLAGRLPYAIEGKPVHEAVRVIREQDPTRLGSIDRSLHGDVDTIVSKALAKEKDRRYQSAAALAADIRRYLADRPIVARPTSALYQLRKFARRNKALVGAAAAVFFVMLGATVFSLREARITRLQRNEAVRREYQARIAAATAALETDDPITARQQLEAADEELRNWEWRYLNGRQDLSAALIDAGDDVAGAGINASASVAVSVSPDGVVRWWDSAGEQVAERDLEIVVRRAAFSSDSSRLAAICGPGHKTLGVWDVTAERAPVSVMRALLEQPGGHVVLSGDGRRVAVEANRSIRVWDAAGLEKASWTVRGREVLAVAISHDGGRLATAADIGRGNFASYAYDADTGMELSSAVHSRDGQSVAISPGGALVATGGLDKAIRVRATDDGRLLHALNGHADVPMVFDFDRTGTRLVSASGDRTIRLWDVGTGQAVAVYRGHTEDVRSLRFSADGSGVLSSSADGMLRLWDAEPAERTTILAGHSSYVYAVDFSADGRRVYSGSWDDTVRIWDAAGGECLVILPTSQVHALAASGHGRFIATAHWGNIVLRDASSFASLRSLSGLRDIAESIVFAESGSRVAAVDREGLGLVWNVETGERVLQFQGPDLRASGLALSPDERLILTSHADGVRTWDAATGDEVADLPTAVPAWCVASSGDGAWIAAGLDDGRIAMWDARTRRRAGDLPGHIGRVYALAFSPDDTRLASGSNDTSIRLWDVASGEPVVKLTGHDDYVYSLAFSPDGDRLVSGSGDFTVRIWDTQPVHVRWRARAELRQLGEEMRPMVQRLYQTLEHYAAVVAAIGTDATLREAERRAALLVALDMRSGN